jgi:hypothetical protein
VNRSFFAREWGAVTFVLTVLIGIIVVPIALIVGNKPPPAPPLPNVTPSVSASPPPAASAPSPTPSASGTP